MLAASPRPLRPARITAPALRRALIAGLRHLVARREALNKINVFPVPDGDTGSNLAFTAGSVLSGSLSRRSRSAGDLLRQVADDAVDGARGNSGAILAQFLQGVGETVAARAVLSPQCLAQAALAGSQQARGALAEPREGTILSVIRAFAEALQAQPGAAARDWRAAFGAALERARVALADTPKQLAVLRQAGVVDAGGQGFVDLLEGIQEFIATGHEGEPVASDIPLDFAGAHLHEDIDPTQRWCSECLVAAEVGQALDRDAIRAAVMALGAGSLVIAGSAQRVRVHAHVAEPAVLFETAGRFGHVSARKAEDMLAQHRTALRAEGVAVVTDSGADLPKELCERLDLHVVPVRVNFGEEDFLDKVSISPSQFYARLKTSAVLPQTSQPPPGDFRRQFEFLLTHHPSLVYVGLSRAVSGTLQSGESAAARVDAARTRVIDSGHASCGQALLAVAAAEAAQRGATPEEIAATVERLRPLTHTFAAARDISHAVRGGRVPRWAKPVAELLGLTPIAKIRADGKLGVFGALWGKRNVPHRFAAYVERHLPRGQRWRVIVGHCDCPDDGAALLAALRERLDCAEIWLVEAGPAVGAHAGPQTLVVGAQPLREVGESG
jgi:DegV family protein with EDD domain